MFLISRVNGQQPEGEKRDVSAKRGHTRKDVQTGIAEFANRWLEQFLLYPLNTKIPRSPFIESAADKTANAIAHMVWHSSRDSSGSRIYTSETIVRNWGGIIYSSAAYNVNS